jgi:hypothetical protein
MFSFGTPAFVLPTLNGIEFDNGNSGTARTINFVVNGPLQRVTRNGSATYTLVPPALPGTCILRFVHETGTATAYTVTYSPAVKNPAGVAFTFTNTSAAIDVMTFYWDGTFFYAVGQANFS